MPSSPSCCAVSLSFVSRTCVCLRVSMDSRYLVYGCGAGGSSRTQCCPRCSAHWHLFIFVVQVFSLIPQYSLAPAHFRCSSIQFDTTIRTGTCSFPLLKYSVYSHNTHWHLLIFVVQVFGYSHNTHWHLLIFVAQVFSLIPQNSLAPVHCRCSSIQFDTTILTGTCSLSLFKNFSFIPRFLN